MKTARLFLLALLCTGVIGPVLNAALPSAADAASKADARFQAHDWPAAAEAYAELARQDSDSGIAHYRLGVASLYLQQIDRGLDELEKARVLGWPPAQVAFRKACAYATSGRIDAAVSEIEKAVSAGFAQTKLLDSEPLLAALRADARWAKVRETVDRKAHPCKYDPRYRDFDFWVGEWDVRPSGAPASTPPAENIVTLVYDDCVVHEHWRSPSSSGESLNIYDASRGEWFQTWVDDGGGLHQYHGNLDQEGNMRFTTDLRYAPGEERRPTRLTFFKVDAKTVRQLSERSEDGGKTWLTNYDLIYKRRAKQPSS